MSCPDFDPGIHLQGGRWREWIAGSSLVKPGNGKNHIIAGGVVPFVAGVLGGWLGERQQGTV